MIPTPRFLLPAVFALASALASPGSAADWERSTAESLPASPGIQLQRQTWRGPDGADATLHVVAFDARKHTLRVFDQGTDGSASLAQTLALAGALAGVNGGYFHPDRRPLGLLVARGQTLHAEERARLLSGLVLVFANGVARLQRPAEPRPQLALREALQAGPFLVDAGLPVPGLEASRAARRTVVVNDGKNGWALISTSRLTLAETAALLASTGVLNSGAIRRALNLDGGSSTAMWVRREGGEAFSIPEFGTVRNFLGIVPR